MFLKISMLSNYFFIIENSLIGTENVIVVSLNFTFPLRYYFLTSFNGNGLSAINHESEYAWNADNK